MMGIIANESFVSTTDMESPGLMACSAFAANNTGFHTRLQSMGWSTTVAMLESGVTKRGSKQPSGSTKSKMAPIRTQCTGEAFISMVPTPSIRAT
jgi:hypothetical protein